ncbi:MAG: LicD family protein [Butyrivibrio sp.]|nr:LicD family protein [Butyrivibrio sp.]
MREFDSKKAEFYLEEVIDGYKVSPKLKHIWGIQLDILERISFVCNKYNLKWFIAHGTLLGAVRHGGYIPWDDDIDINMPREDFEKLMSVAQKEFMNPYYCQWDEWDPRFLGFARVRYANSTALFYGDISYGDVNGGIWVDIFPMDGVIEDEDERAAQSEELERYRRLNYADTYGDFYYAYYGIDDVSWTGYIEEARALTDKYGRKWLRQQFVDICKRGNTGHEVRSAIHCLRTNYECCYWFKEDYDELIDINFMGKKYPAPKGWERCLKIKWKDYMQFPPVEQRGYKHLEHIIDPYIPYYEYPFERFTSFHKFNMHRKLILVCAGRACDDFIERYRNQYDISIIVDNSTHLQGQKKMGIIIRPVEYLKDIIHKKEYQVILCTSYYVEVQEQVKSYGFDESYIYIKDRKYI